MRDIDRKELERQLHSAEKLCRAAIETSKAVQEEFGEMMAHPDGAAALHNAATNGRIAIQKYRRALTAFNDLVVFDRPPASQFGEDPEPTVALTPREVEVLKLIASGSSSKRIAAQLGITCRTATSHRSHIMDKLGIHDAVSLLRYAIRRKLIEP